MSAEGWVAIITAIGVSLAIPLVGMLLKWRQDRQQEENRRDSEKTKDAVAVLTAHIDRLEAEIVSDQKQLHQKQEAIDELAYLQARCELREEAAYGLMLRFKEHMDRQDASIVALGGTPPPPVELPPRPQGSDADRAAYLQRRSTYNTKLSAAVADSVLSHSPVKGD